MESVGKWSTGLRRGQNYASCETLDRRDFSAAFSGWRHSALWLLVPFLLLSSVKIQNPEVSVLLWWLARKVPGTLSYSLRSPHNRDKWFPRMKLGCCYQKKGSELWQLKSNRCSLWYLTFCLCRITVYNASHKNSYQ